MRKTLELSNNCYDCSKVSNCRAFEITARMLDIYNASFNNSNMNSDKATLINGLKFGSKSVNLDFRIVDIQAKMDACIGGLAYSKFEKDSNIDALERALNRATTKTD